MKEGKKSLNFRKFRVALNPMYRIFFNFAKSCILSCLSKFYNKKKIHHAVFEIKALKAEIKGVFSRSKCCYGNLLCHKNNTKVFTSDWAFFGTMIVATIDRVLIMTHQNLHLGKSWKLF